MTQQNWKRLEEIRRLRALGNAREMIGRSGETRCRFGVCGLCDRAECVRLRAQQAVAREAAEKTWSELTRSLLSHAGAVADVVRAMARKAVGRSGNERR
jgi:hypothetical protein